MHLRDLMEPEETVGNLWHDMANSIGAAKTYPDAAVLLSQVRPSLVLLFRALGGNPGMELGEAPASLITHRRATHRKIGAEREKEWVASFDGDHLRLPPVIAVFPEATLNKAAYFWLVALAAHVQVPISTANLRARDCQTMMEEAAPKEAM